jgi:hypothetical protein
MKKTVIYLLLLALAGCGDSGKQKHASGCKNSVLYGYVSICLPEIKGMTECHTHAGVQQVIQPYLPTTPILGYYLNNATYKQVDRLSEITYEDYFMLYGDYQKENYHAQEADLHAMAQELEQTLFEESNFKQLSSRIEEYYGSITAGKPALIEKYAPQDNVRTLIVLMKYKGEDGTETSVVSAVNLLLVKNRLLNLAYYVAYAGGKSIDVLKEKNATVIQQLLAIN